jgi:multicomponent Na+:H+ antiporter subunit B
MEQIIDLLLLLLLIAMAIAMARLTNLIAVAILGGVYSLVLSAIYVLLDAVDVAFTEAAVGAGITLTLLLAAISLSVRRERVRHWPVRNAIAVATCLVVAAGMFYASLEMPAFGDPDAPIHNHVAPRYIEDSPQEIGVPNMVTSILASYRGFDTLGETTVIFTAGIAVLALLWRWRKDGQ